jgi:hypothetical protein
LKHVYNSRDVERHFGVGADLHNLLAPGNEYVTNLGAIVQNNGDTRRAVARLLPSPGGYRLLDSFIDYYNQDRTHFGLSKDSLLGRPVEQRPLGATSNVVSPPRVGGLHHRYAWRQAA